MFSIDEKRVISHKLQLILKKTNHPKLLNSEVKFYLQIYGDSRECISSIKNNSAATPNINNFFDIDKLLEEENAATPNTTIFDNMKIITRGKTNGKY